MSQNGEHRRGRWADVTAVRPVVVIAVSCLLCMWIAAACGHGHVAAESRAGQVATRGFHTAVSCDWHGAPTGDHVGFGDELFYCNDEFGSDIDCYVTVGAESGQQADFYRCYVFSGLEEDAGSWVCIVDTQGAVNVRSPLHHGGGWMDDPAACPSAA